MKHARYVAISGASNGLGRALALAYASPGAVLGLCGRNAGALDTVAELCRAKGAQVVASVVDVRDTRAVAEWLDGFDDCFPLDLLIANAGIASTLTSTGSLEDAEVTAQVMVTNFQGAVNTLLPAIARMRARGAGQVAIVSSLAALHGMAISPAYCASKAAIRAYGESIRPILARDGVSLSLIFPGFVKTAMSDVFPGDKPFLWTSERAAEHIRRGLVTRRAEIAFPASLAFGMRLLPLLPASLADWILNRLSYLPREGA
ncbi:SDR family NAD(P)-dependent oxidoreductase [Burkholderia pyrrocinia]|uniref:SDR family NAD(P)-dependent oxidoreductase n=1 Tax=Burkholderia pyrrocinia TaxID=60550 RepID=UPI002AB216C0|nr:SDR family NAD(P)-dependent oxidoreductase [Burkholderia pyrrocinia]